MANTIGIGTKTVQCPFCRKSKTVPLHSTSVACSCGKSFILKDMTLKRQYP